MDERDEGADPLPDARPPRLAVRARLLPLPSSRRPIFVVREHHRHRIGHSFNELSRALLEARGRVLRPRLTCARRSASRAPTRFEPVEPELAERTRERAPAVVRAGVRGLRADARAGRRAGGRAHRAAARDVHASTTGAATPRSLMHFCSLRNSEHAQFEIREYARGGRELPRRAHAGHARRLRGERAHRPLTRGAALARRSADQPAPGGSSVRTS